MSYSHNSFPTDGAEIPHVDLTQEEKDVVKLFFDGITTGASPFVNPYRENIESVKDKINAFRDIVIELQQDEDNSDVVYDTLIAVLDGLFDRIANVDNANFLTHTDRLSGASLEPDGELLDYASLQSVAASYNSVLEAMREEDEPVKDNYSVFFSSLFIAGDLTSRLDELMSVGTGDLDPNTNSGGITGAQGYVNAIAQQGQFSLNTVQEHIASDNAYAAIALNTLKRFGLGISTINMNKDTFFAKKVIDVSAGPSLASELNDLSEE
jgi:hypothetical protein